MPLRWIAALAVLIADSFVRAENYRLSLDNMAKRDEIDWLKHVIVLEQQRAAAAEQMADLAQMAQETNLKLLDKIVFTHGQQSQRNP